MTYHPQDLLRAVDELTLEVREPVTRVINGTTRTERVTHPPLLVQLEEAIHGSMRSGSGASSNLPGTAIPLDGDALYQFTIISSQITDWCRIAGADRHRHPVDGLRAWHATTLTDRDVDRTVEVGILRAWAGVIRAKLTPRRTLDLPDPCPECRAEEWSDDDGNAGLRPLIITYTEGAEDLLSTVVTRCRACGMQTTGSNGARELAWALENARTINETGWAIDEDDNMTDCETTNHTNGRSGR